MRFLSFLFVLVLCLQATAQLPEDFDDQLVADNWQSVVGLTFDANGRMYTWAKHGVVRIAEDGVQLPEPLVDISEECANWGDHGLLGFALHPNFLENGFFYLLYAVDRHHLLFYGTPQYDPEVSLSHVPSIGRLVRYTADPGTDFTSTIAGSRKVLIGDSITNGIPLLHVSHGVGSLVFGNDGTLLLTVGDGGSYAGEDLGGETAGAFAPQALIDGIITADQDVGAFRAQLVNSLNGKVLRIDPETGDGIPSNPFFDPNDPRAPQSRVWALGLRNPYRFSIQPGTGSHYPEDGDPGVLWIGDVGWAFWEEFNRVDRGGLNMGWPLYEGLRSRWQYQSNRIPNYLAANPLYGSGDCTQEFFYFQDLLKDAQQDPNVFFPNPCNQALSVPAEIPTFLHHRPVIAWSNIEWNTEEQDTHIPGFDDEGQSKIYSIDDPDCPVDGSFFTGKCAIGGVWINDNNWPEEYRNKYYGADYTGWFKQLSLDANGTLQSVSDFFDEGENIVDMALNPVDGCLYYIEYAYYSTVRKICFGGNPPPTARIGLDREYGPGPLDVQFSALASSDPEGEPLTYHWDFGDGVTSEDAEPVHQFASEGGKPTPHLVTLTVTDTAGGSHTAYATISVDNTPPSVRISSFEDSALYSMHGVTRLPLIAEAADNEDRPENLEYAWQVFLHHNTHNHPEAIIPDVETVTFLYPEGCGDEDFWYRVSVTVRDAGGLEAYDEKELFPLCAAPVTRFDSIAADPGEELVTVTWSTLEEVPGSQFIIEKSLDKTHYELAATIPANGNPSTYSIEDHTPLNGISFYRVKTLLPDGFKDFSPLAEAEFPGVDGVRLQPVPFEDRLTIVFEQVEGLAEFRLYSMQGALLRRYSWKGSGEKVPYSFRYPELPAGVYLYEATDGRSRYFGKIIKQ